MLLVVFAFNECLVSVWLNLERQIVVFFILEVKEKLILATWALVLLLVVCDFNKFRSASTLGASGGLVAGYVGVQLMQ
jgi:hypothetical protein